MDIFYKLSLSKFRSKFKLSKKDIEYINLKTLPVIKEHALDFVKKRLADAKILNDGKQTPMRGHPVFVAMHATATCCRGCLYKWHKISKNKELTDNEITYVVDIIMKWIESEYIKNI